MLLFIDQWQGLVMIFLTIIALGHTVSPEPRKLKKTRNGWTVFLPMTCYIVGPQQTATSRIYDDHLLYFLVEFLKGPNFLVIPQFFEVLLCDSCFQSRAYIKFSKGSCKMSDGRFCLLHSVVPSCTDLNHNL